MEKIGCEGCLLSQAPYILTFMTTSDLGWAETLLAGTGVSPARAAHLAAGGAPGDATEAAVAPALVAGWAAAAGVDPATVIADEGSVELFDLGVRLRAAVTGTLQHRLAHRVAVGDWPLVAVSLADDRGEVAFTVERPGQAPVSGSVEVALGALGVTLPAGNGPAPVGECLVVASRAHLHRLVAAAEAVAEGGPYEVAAARVSWWGQRAEHPGSAAVVVVPDACRQRWATGGDPAAEAAVGTWAGWLGLGGGSRPTTALLGAAAALRAGRLLPALDDAVRGSGKVEPGRESDDAGAWGAFVAARKGNRRWRGGDSALSAAIGLRSRSDAAEFWERALLEDPLWALRGRFAGRVVAATVESMAGASALRLVTTQAACRFRPGSKVVLRTADASLKAELASIAMSGDGRLVIDVETARTARLHLTVGQRVEMVSEPVSMGRMVSARVNVAERFSFPAWARDRTPAPRIRREIPLDVMVAASED
ncbi:MAG TPA: hypothetical protein VM263_07980 [Acidimicrobiales bacterium]|nr:hypothetical protein [Acidimicrobiales bacterium]